MVKKKSYNPFKMWGSYVVAVLLLSFMIITSIWVNDINSRLEGCVEDIPQNTDLSMLSSETFLSARDRICIDVGCSEFQEERIPACLFYTETLDNYNPLFLNFVGKNNLLLAIPLGLYAILGFFIGWVIHSFFRKVIK